MTRSTSPSSTTSSSSGLYIPVHRRPRASSPASTSRSYSSRESTISSDSDSDSAIVPPSQAPFIYSRDALLNLSRSPLTHFPMELRRSLREEVPEIVTNRKQRKAIEHRKQLLKTEEQVITALPAVPAATTKSPSTRSPSSRSSSRSWDTKSNASSSSRTSSSSSWRGRQSAMPMV